MRNLMMIRGIAAVAVVALVVPAVMAAPLLPGTSHVRPGVGLVGTGYTVGAPPTVGAPLASMTSVFTELVGFEGITGEVTSQVFASTGGGLVFTYQFTSYGTTTNPLVRASLAGSGWVTTAIIDNGIDPATVSAGQSTLGGGAIQWNDGAPNIHERNPLFGGATIAIQYRVGSDGTVLAAGDVSALSWFDTDAATWEVADVGLLDSGSVSGAQVFAPAPIPAPGAVLLGAMGLGLVGWVKRRLA